MYTFTFILFAILLIMAIREGLLLKWYLTGYKPFLSTLWHWFGMLSRALIVAFAIYQYFPNVYDMILIGLLGLNWSWTLYDACINLVNNWKLWYTGKTSEFEVVLKSKFIWIAKAVLFIGTVIYIIWYFT